MRTSQRAAELAVFRSEELVVKAKFVNEKEAKSSPSTSWLIVSFRVAVANYIFWLQIFTETWQSQNSPAGSEESQK